jgi:quinone-modifying oxidoreductase subunit QmoA
LSDDVITDSSGFMEGTDDGGQFSAGAASGPLDVNRSVQSATAAALRSIRIVRRNASPSHAAGAVDAAGSARVSA